MLMVNGTNVTSVDLNGTNLSSIWVCNTSNATCCKVFPSSGYVRFEMSVSRTSYTRPPIASRNSKYDARKVTCAEFVGEGTYTCLFSTGSIKSCPNPAYNTFQITTGPVDETFTETFEVSITPKESFGIPYTGPWCVSLKPIGVVDECAFVYSGWQHGDSSLTGKAIIDVNTCFTDNGCSLTFDENGGTSCISIDRCVISSDVCSSNPSTSQDVAKAYLSSGLSADCGLRVCWNLTLCVGGQTIIDCNFLAEGTGKLEDIYRYID